jgi:hypothetical protein
MGNFEHARIAHFGRKHAEHAVEMAVLVCEAARPSAAQLRDLRQAVAALSIGDYRSAVALGEGVIEHETRAQSAVRKESRPNSAEEQSAQASTAPALDRPGLNRSSDDT